MNILLVISNLQAAISVIDNAAAGIGLINAKNVGGWKATGDIIAFLDCHVKPDIYW